MKNINFTFSCEYASQAIELNNRIPYGYVDKTVCGCGLTTLALENNRDTIIAVPNLDLIDNKIAQYPNKKCNYKIFGVYGGITIENVNSYIKSLGEKQPVKIMVTYDSFYKVETLMGNPNFDIVIDESQELLQSLNLKLTNKEVDKEDVLSYLYRITEKYKERVSFISATPIPPKYLAPFISELSQVTINWLNTIEVKPYLLQRAQPLASLRKELIQPILDNGCVSIGDITTKKLIIFVNSISGIKKIIKDCNIEPCNVGYIVGKNLRNDADFKKYKRVGPNDILPSFTFITSTGFKGIDLQDSEALNVVVSITTKDHTMVNMKTDLKQAISRQRDKSNVNYGKYIFLYNQTVFEDTDEEVIAKIKQVKADVTEGIEVYRVIKREKLKRGLATMISDTSDFTHYTVYDEENDDYRLNEPAFNADEYFILELRKQYKKGFKMQRAIGSESVKIEKIVIANDWKYEDLVTYFTKQIKTCKSSEIDWNVYTKYKTWIDVIVKSYELYGKVWKKQSYAEEMIANYHSPDEHFRVKLQNTFNVGVRYARSDVKIKLTALYKEFGIKRLAKYTDLNDYFETKEVKILGDRVVEIIKRR